MRQVLYCAAAVNDGEGEEGESLIREFCMDNERCKMLLPILSMFTGFADLE